MAPPHPEWKEKEPFASLLKGHTKGALAGGQKSARRGRGERLDRRRHETGLEGRLPAREVVTRGQRRERPKQPESNKPGFDRRAIQATCRR